MHIQLTRKECNMSDLNGIKITRKDGQCQVCNGVNTTGANQQLKAVGITGLTDATIQICDVCRFRLNYSIDEALRD